MKFCFEKINECNEWVETRRIRKYLVPRNNNLKRYDWLKGKQEHGRTLRVLKKSDTTGQDFTD